MYRFIQIILAEVAELNFLISMQWIAPITEPQSRYILQNFLMLETFIFRQRETYTCNTCKINNITNQQRYTFCTCITVSSTFSYFYEIHAVQQMMFMDTMHI